MEERKQLLKKMGNNYDEESFTSLMARHTEKEDEMVRHVDPLKNIVRPAKSSCGISA